ncbi:MAG: glycosyltransferase family 39 protein [Deltaproteobacteria bacterium]|nr:glycosyltransferase family 39 protein [Deltaproteobacteria bacterium]
MKHSLDKLYIYFLFLIIVLFSTLTLSISVNKKFAADELEHVHSAWYIENNHVPYSDFFEHHHPLLWYLILPFLLLFDYSAKTLIAMRLMIFILTAGIGFFTYLITKKITKSTEAGFTSVILLLSVVVFIKRAVEIRPDVPQVFLGLASIYYLLIFFQSKENKYMIFGGLSLAVSFLFLQKAIFLLIAYLFIFVFKLFRRELPIKSVFYFNICFSLPVLFFLGYLIISGSFNEYIAANWILNKPFLGISSPLAILEKTGILTDVNTLFWLFSAVSILWILFSKKTNGDLRAIAFVGLVLFSSIFFFECSYVYTQYLMPAIPLLSIAIAYFLKISCDRLNISVIGKIVVIIIFIFIPLYQMVHLGSGKIKRKTWIHQLTVITFVIQSSDDSDLIYACSPTVNLFRHDLRYLWFYPISFQNSIKRAGERIYNILIRDKNEDYDICELIKDRKPKFITKCGIKDCPSLKGLYSSTAYRNLYIRNIEQR